MTADEQAAADAGATYRAIFSALQEYGGRIQECADSVRHAGLLGAAGIPMARKSVERCRRLCEQMAEKLAQADAMLHGTRPADPALAPTREVRRRGT